jgi:hypothetical protein
MQTDTMEHLGVLTAMALPSLVLYIAPGPFQDFPRRFSPS